jgi:hypothetical protein
MISASRPAEIRLWWPLPLAALVWLLIIWGFGFFLTASEQEIVTPPPIEARFIELPESDLDLDPLPPPPKGVQAQPEVSQPSQPAQITPPTPRPSPPARPQIRPKAIEEIETAKALPEREQAETDTAPQTAATDLSDYINQARARRQPKGIFDGAEHSKTEIAEPQPTADEIRMANVRRNLQVPGTSGIFRIISIGPRYAQFSFRSWTTGDYNPRRVLIEVEAGPDGDVERAIIRKMIELIRQYHQDDFNWESHRLNRVIVLSARLRDNEGLEDFMMREFFINTDTPPYMR